MICRGCHQDKAESEFNKSQIRCRQCASEYNAARYAAQPERFRAAERARRQRIVGIVNDRKAVPCTDCGVSYPSYVMDFDHLGDKVRGISYMARHYSVEKVLAEIEKCEVVCANCHRERTYHRSVNG